MAKLQTKKININDFSSASKDDVSKLARSLNPFFDDIERALRKGLTVEDNLPFEYTTVDVELDYAGNPKQSTNLSFSLTNVKGCVIINAQAKAIGVYPTAAPFISYSVSGSILTIKNVTGLPQDIKFTLTLILMA